MPKLSDKQREAYQLAVEKGYYSFPDHFLDKWITKREQPEPKDREDGEPIRGRSITLGYINVSISADKSNLTKSLKGSKK